MISLEDGVRQIFQPFSELENNPENRIKLTERLDYYFAFLDTKGYSRPVDFNVTIGDTGELQVFFAKDFTDGKDI